MFSLPSSPSSFGKSAVRFNFEVECRDSVVFLSSKLRQTCDEYTLPPFGEVVFDGC